MKLIVEELDLNDVYADSKSFASSLTMMNLFFSVSEECD